MRPSANSLIARKPAFLFALANGSVIFFALIMYFSGTPANLILVSSFATLAMTNALLIFMRRRVPPKGASDRPSRVTPSKKVRLYLVLGILMLVNSSWQIARATLPSDIPLGIVILICALACFLIAWNEFRKKTPPEALEWQATDL